MTSHAGVFANALILAVIVSTSPEVAAQYKRVTEAAGKRDITVPTLDLAVRAAVKAARDAGFDGASVTASTIHAHMPVRVSRYTESEECDGVNRSGVCTGCRKVRREQGTSSGRFTLYVELKGSSRGRVRVTAEIWPAAQKSRSVSRSGCIVASEDSYTTDRSAGERELNQFFDALDGHVRALTPSPAQQHVDRGIVLAGQKRWKEAEAEFRQAVRLDNANSEFHNRLGWALEHQQKFDEAEAEYRHSIKLGGTNQASAFALGKMLSLQKKWTEAETYYRQVLQATPKFVAYLELLGEMLIEQQKWKEAEVEYQKLALLMPGDYDAIVGWLLVRQQRYTEAEAEYRKAVKLRPGHASDHAGLGEALWRQDKFPAAEAAFREAIKLDLKAEPRAGSFRHGLGLALYRQHKLAEAMTELQQAVAVEPGNVWFAKDFGKLLDQQERWLEAEGVYRDALRHNPADPELLGLLGYLLADRGKNLQEALQLTERAVNADPANGYLIGARGWSYFKMGRLEEAERDTMRAATLVPDYPLVQEHLGDVYLQRGKGEQARAAWTKALSLSKDAAQKARLNAKLAGR